MKWWAIAWFASMLAVVLVVWAFAWVWVTALKQEGPGP